jgi:hypothetical protein
MISFSEWVKKNHGVELDEAATTSGGAASGATDSGDSARFARPLGGGEKEDKMVRRMAPKPILMDVSGNARKKEDGKSKKCKDEPPTKTKQMVDDFDDLPEPK